MNEVALLAEALLIGLGAWRLASLLANERGPYNVFLNFRERLGYEHGDDGHPTAWPGGWREAFSCVWCLSPWTAAACYGLWVWEPLIIVVLAASTFVVAIERYSNG